MLLKFASSKHNQTTSINIYRRLRGSGAAPVTGKSDSFRSCVRASEAVCARERVILHPLGWANSRCPPAFSGAQVVSITFAGQALGF